MPPPNKKSKKSAVDDKATLKTTPTAHVQRPQWPPLQLERPNDMLSLHHLMPAQIVTISNFWSAALCKRYVTFLSSLPLVTTPGVPKKGDAVRVNDRFQVDDPEFAGLLWNSTGLKELVLGEDGEQGDDKFWGGEVLGLNPNIRIYRYRKGQFFDQHYDDSNNLELPGTPPTRAKTTWTLLLYLTSSSNGCVGGETVFYPSSLPSSGKKSAQPTEPVSVALETGMALLHKHGRDCMLHEGREVLDGEKWVIRSDLCVRR